MDWADEHYIKFFTRDTVTWNRWPWQAQAVLGPLMRKLNKAGVVDVDPRFGIGESIAALLGPKWPPDVVREAIAAYIESGTFEVVGSKLVMPKFLEAQESRKTKQVIAHDYRQKQRDVARAKSAGLLEPVVTIRDQTGPTATIRTNLNPPAQPSPAQPQPSPLKTLVDKTESLTRDGKATGDDRPPAQKSSGQREALQLIADVITSSEVEEQVFDHWRTVMGKTEGALFTRDRREKVRARLAEGFTVEQLKGAVDGCSKTPHNMGQNDTGERWDDLALICRNGAQVERFIRNATAPPKGSAVRAQSMTGLEGSGPLTATEGVL